MPPAGPNGVRLNLYLDGNTAIAEWDAEFDDLTQGVRKHMIEVAILEFEGKLVGSLREYWSSEVSRPLRPIPSLGSTPEELRALQLSLPSSG